MTPETMEELIKKALEYAEKECTVTFQGGEPTLIGLDFFKDVIKAEKKYNKNRVVIHNAIQTNGIAVTKEWAEFFKENNFLVGISLDGIKDTHDYNRIDKKENGTFNTVMRTIQMLESHKVQYNILTVVNKQTAKKITSIYNFYKKNNLKYLQFIPCLDPLEKKEGQEDYSLSPMDYGKFLITLFDLWYRDIKTGTSPSIRQFENYTEMLLGYPPEACGMGGTCGFQHVFEADGSVYPCDFYVLDKYRLGNINENTFAEINEKRQQIRFVEDSKVIAEKCRNCGYYPLCRGGCRRNRTVSENGELGLNYFCESYEMFFSHALPYLNSLAKIIHRSKYK